MPGQVQKKAYLNPEDDQHAKEKQAWKRRPAKMQKQMQAWK